LFEKETNEITKTDASIFYSSLLAGQIDVSLASTLMEQNINPNQTLLLVFQIFLSRGNVAKKREDQFNNEMSAGLHFGPDPTTDRFSLAQGLYKLYRLFFNDQF